MKKQDKKNEIVPPMTPEEFDNEYGMFRKISSERVYQMAKDAACRGLKKSSSTQPH